MKRLSLNRQHPQKDQLHLINTAVQVASQYVKSQHEIFYLGGADPYADVAVFDKLCASNAADRMTASEVWSHLLERFDVLYEDTWLANIGE